MHFETLNGEEEKKGKKAGMGRVRKEDRVGGERRAVLFDTYPVCASIVV